RAVRDGGTTRRASSGRSGDGPAFRGRALRAPHGGASPPRSRIASRARERVQLPGHPARARSIELTPHERGIDMSIRPNRVKQRLAAGQVATIVAGTNEPDLIDQLGPVGADGVWLEGEHGGVDYADLGNLTRACDLWGMTSVVRVMDNDYATI